VIGVRRLAGMIVVVAAAAVLIVAAGVSESSTGSRMAADSGAAAQAAAWGTAREVPGLAALNQYGSSKVNSISCAAPGNCTAGGSYMDRSRRQQAFVVSEVNGIWRSAVGIPGLAALNQGGGAAVSSVSCASVGNCSAGGAYQDSLRRGQAFVANEVHGVWHAAMKVPGIPALARIGRAAVTSVSCASAGNCSAGGSYGSVIGISWPMHAFVVSEVNGIWRTAIKVPGLAALNQGVNAGVSSVSCRAAGDCGASGFYADRAGNLHGFLVGQVRGSWHTAIRVPGLVSRAQIGSAGAGSLSCASAGNCSSGADYADSSGRSQAYVVSEVSGSWRTALEVPGTAALNKGGNAEVVSVSCASVGNCGAGGHYANTLGHTQAFVVSQVNGIWQKAVQVQGAAARNQTGIGSVITMSCASAGNCSAGGNYLDQYGRYQAFVLTEVSGTWQTSLEVPGTAVLNQGGDAQVSTVSCGSPGKCSAGGYYTGKNGYMQAFVVSES
jgi:hypothetical protein